MIPINPTSPPQKNSENPQVEQAKQQLLQAIQQGQTNPTTLLKLGQYANTALKNKKMYPIVIQSAIREGLITQDDVQPGVIDYKFLSFALTAGKLTKMLIDEGKINGMV